MSRSTAITAASHQVLRGLCVLRGEDSHEEHKGHEKKYGRSFGAGKDASDSGLRGAGKHPFAPRRFD
jgi:hypothetical protein